MQRERNTEQMAGQARSPVASPLLGVEEVCALLHMSRVSLWRLRKRHRTFPTPLQFGQRRILWVQEAIIAWLAAQQQAPVVDVSPFTPRPRR
jgi:predicted DNA-binding transcriptional regulator AlpA